jgi:hypothetical protein
VSNLLNSNLRQLEFVVGSQGELDVCNIDHFISSVQLGLDSIIPDGLGSDLQHDFLIEVLQVVGGFDVGDNCLQCCHANPNFLSNILLDQNAFVQQLFHE